MNPVKSVRTAAAVSLVLLGLWLFLNAVSYIFQPEILDYLCGGVLDFEDRIFLLVTVSEILEALLIAAAAVMLYSGKGHYSPLVISSVAFGVSPAVSRLLNFIQMKFTSTFDGVEGVAAISSFSIVIDRLGYLITAGGVTVIAAAAVNAYAKNREAERAFPTDFNESV